jgi:WD40 repeat protein
MPELAVVVAGLNSTMAESHRGDDHYGWVGERQMRWFASRLAGYRDRGWLRLAAVHHNVVRGAGLDEENLLDADDLDRILGEPGLVNLLLHGHTHDAKLHYLSSSGLPVLSTGSPAMAAAARPAEAPNQYQLITVRRDGLTRHVRQYALGQRRWIGDTRISPTGSDWHDRRRLELADVDALFAEVPPEEPMPPSGAGSASFLERVAEATKVRYPDATVTERPESGYLRVSRPHGDGGAVQWPVGVIGGPATEAALESFVTKIHAQFAAADPSVPSELVYGGPKASAHLVVLALRRGVRLRSFVEYQGMIDLRPLVEAQGERLAADWIYPAQLYVEQRFQVAGSSDTRTGLIEQVIIWLGADDARLVVVLGDSGRGKTSFLRQLTRRLPDELPSVLPVLVELRTLEKAPTLDELLAQHLVRQGVEDINPAKLRYMIQSGRIALLFDGFDELELRVGYDNAADYLQALLDSVTGRAKVVLTSRTQHFRSTGQVMTALGERVSTRAASRLVVLEDFSEEQIIQCLTNLYGGDEANARARFDLLGEIGNLLDLARNPQLLAFVAALEDTRLHEVRRKEGHFTQATLYGEIIGFWLGRETDREQHEQGMPYFTEEERLTACWELAFFLWVSAKPTIALSELSAAVSATLNGFSERGYTEHEATHTIASGTLLVRTKDGAFTFIHQSVMEWLVAKGAADNRQAGILTRRQMSPLMAEFFVHLAGVAAARRRADTLANSKTQQTAKHNALAIRDRLRALGHDVSVNQDLAGMDLREWDMTGRDYSGRNLHGAKMLGMRLAGTDLSGADLRDADLRGVRMTGGSLTGALLGGSRWDRAAILGTKGLDDLEAAPDLEDAAIASRDPAEVMIRPPFRPNRIAFSPDGSLLVIGSSGVAEIIDAADGRVLRLLQGHAGLVTDVAFSPDGMLIATASSDGIARTWDAATGMPRTTFTGHSGPVTAIAFSPDGTLIATASGDGTARTWDAATGAPRTTLIGHTGTLNDLAFSPDGTLIATASDDRTGRTWDAATGAARTTLTGHRGPVTAVAFCLVNAGDGTLLATASSDGTARTWDAATGAPRTTLTGHRGPVTAVVFSPVNAGDGTLLATAGDGTVRTWDAGTGTLRTTLIGHREPVTDIAFSPDGALLATASSDGTARTWDAATGAPRTILTGDHATVTDVAFSPDGALLATASSDGTARTWDTAKGTPCTTFTGHSGAVTDVAFSPGGALLATASSDGTVRTWDTATGTPRITSILAGNHGTATAVAFSPDGTRLTSAFSDGTIRTWDTATSIITRDTHTGRHGAATAVAFSPDAALLATAYGDGTVCTWDTATGTARTTFTGHSNRLTAAAFSPDAALLATAYGDGTVCTWDTATGTARTTFTGHSNRVTAAVFSPDGTLIATASSDGTARTWEAATGTPRTTLTGHHGPIGAVAFSRDGAFLATASSDGTARTWNTATGAVVVTLIPLRSGYAAVLPDGGYKLDGNPGDRLWWAMKLCRFAPGDLDPYVDGLQLLATNVPVLPLSR